MGSYCNAWDEECGRIGLGGGYIELYCWIDLMAVVWIVLLLLVEWLVLIWMLEMLCKLVLVVARAE